jgi:hypothetical protein
MVLVVNKYDLVQPLEEKGQELEDFMTQDYLENFAFDNGFIGVMRTSAKTGLNVNTAFSMLVKDIVVKEFSNKQSQESGMGVGQGQGYGAGFE